MKKYIKNNLLKSIALVGLISSVVLVSCDRELEPEYPAIQIKPVVGFQSASYEVNEGKNVEITLVSNVAFNDAMHFQLDVIRTKSTASDTDDFSMNIDHVDLDWGTVDSYRIDFPGYSKEFTFSLSAILDDEIEADEIAYLKIIPRGNINGEVDPSSSETKVTIHHRGANTVDFSFAWNRTFDYAGNTYSLCQVGYDVDYYIFDTDFNDITEYAMATAACPETYAMDLSTLPDGDYDAYANLWDNVGIDGLGFSPALSIPTTVTFDRAASTLSGSFVQNSANAFDSDTPSDQAGNDIRYVVTISVADGIVTLKDNGSVIATGKNSRLDKARAVINARNK